jgi:hypothetical protein
MRATTLALAMLAALPTTAACVADGGDPDEVSNDGDDDGDDSYQPWAPKADGQNGLGGAIEFAAACSAGPRLTLAAVGDVLLHGPLQQQAIARGARDRFASLWAPVRDLLAAADVTYANFEGPTAAGVAATGRATTDPGLRFDGVVYSSYPQFNYHGYLVDDLKSSGFDVVSTANNHSLDRRELGADRTIERLREVGMPYTGTRRRDEPDAPWHTVTEQGGFRLAWVACTYGTNGLPDPRQQVLGCWEDETELRGLIGRLRGTAGIDAVIVTPHWGEEYTASPSRAQRDLARRLVDAGATLVLGSHPHVLQPWEKLKAADGREALVIYSLGNFVSGQTHLARRSTLLLYVGLTRTSQGVVVNGVSYVPMIMNTRDGVRGVEAIDRAGGSTDSRALTVGMFGTQNLQDPAQPIRTSRCP